MGGVFQNRYRNSRVTRAQIAMVYMKTFKGANFNNVFYSLLKNVLCDQKLI